MKEFKKVIKLPPANGITGRVSNPYKEYSILRKHSKDFDAWVRRTYGRQSARCFYCNCDLSHKRINVEHIIPMSKGGKTSSNNMVISCAPCNKEKGSKLIAKNVIEKKIKKAAKRYRRSAIRYKHDIKVQEDIAQSLRWIC